MLGLFCKIDMQAQADDRCTLRSGCIFQLWRNCGIFRLTYLPCTLPSAFSTGISSEASLLSNSVPPSEASSQLLSTSPSSTSLSSYPTAAPFLTPSTDTSFVPSNTGTPIGITLSSSDSPSLLLSSSPSQFTSIDPTITPLSANSISPTIHLLTLSHSKISSDSPAITAVPSTKGFTTEPSAVLSLYTALFPLLSLTSLKAIFSQILTLRALAGRKGLFSLSVIFSP